MKRTKLLIATWLVSAVLLFGACDFTADTNTGKAQKKEKTTKYYLSDENGKDIPIEGAPAEEEISLDTLYVLGLSNKVSGNANGSHSNISARVANKSGEEYTINDNGGLLAYSERGDEIVVRTYIEPYVDIYNPYYGNEIKIYYKKQKVTRTVEHLTTKRMKEKWLKTR